MKYGHVGRPTNEEVKARKRKILIKTLTPCFIIAIAVVAIIAKGGLSNLMGSSVDTCKYQCEEGLKLCKIGSTAYCCTENVSTVTKDAYILGDYDQNGVINIQDYNKLKASVETEEDLSTTEQVVSDINQDQIVDQEDVSELLEMISGHENSADIPKTYVCDNDVDDTDNENSTVASKITYELIGAQCVETSVTREAKAKAVCQDNLPHQGQSTTTTTTTKKVEPTEEVDSSNVTSINMSVQTCVNDKCNQPGETYVENTNSEEYNDVPDEGDQDDNEFDSDDSDADEDYDYDGDDYYDDDDDYSVIIDKKSNQFNYSVSGKEIGTLNIKSNNKSSYILENNQRSNASISVENIEYGIYNNAECSGNPIKLITGSGQKNSTWVITSSNKNADSKVNQIVLKASFFEGASVNENTVLYLKPIANKIPQGYAIDTTCKSFTIGKNETVSFDYTPKSDNYFVYLAIDNSIVGQNSAKLKYDSSHKIRFYSSDSVLINNKVTKTGYSFMGWSIKNSSDQYLCYASNQKSTKWAKSCTYGKVLIQSGGNVIDTLKGLITKNSEIITLKSEWKYKSTVKVTFKNAKNSKYKYIRHALIRLYNDKAVCESDLTNSKSTKAVATVKNADGTIAKQGRAGWIVKKVQYSKNWSKNKGYIQFSKLLDSTKIYYLLALPSSYYKNPTTTSEGKCIAISAGNIEKTVKFQPKSFKIQYKGGSKATGKMSDTTKYTDVPVKLSANKFKRSGYTFIYWHATRKAKINNKVVTQYRCYTAKNHKTFKWTDNKNYCTKYGYVKYKDKASFNSNSGGAEAAGYSIVLHAHWSKGTTKKTTTKKTTMKKTTTKKKTTKKTTTKKKTTKKTSKNEKSFKIIFYDVNGKKIDERYKTRGVDTTIDVAAPSGYNWYVIKNESGKNMYYCLEKYADLSGDPKIQEAKWKENKCNTYKYTGTKHKGEQKWIFMKYNKGSVLRIDVAQGGYIKMRPIKK